MGGGGGGGSLLDCMEQHFTVEKEFWHYGRIATHEIKGTHWKS